MGSDTTTDVRRTYTPCLDDEAAPGPLVDDKRTGEADKGLTNRKEATREEMREARLPLAYRDSCAHLLIPLNQCRKETWYAPWKCEVRILP